jgi:hypothetical protein
MQTTETACCPSLYAVQSHIPPLHKCFLESMTACCELDSQATAHTTWPSVDTSATSELGFFMCKLFLAGLGWNWKRLLLRITWLIMN